MAGFGLVCWLVTRWRWFGALEFGRGGFEMIDIRHGSNLDILPLLQPESVDAIITDPEYGTASKTKVTKRDNKLVEFNIEWDQELPLDWIALAAKALKPGGAFIAFTDNSKTETIKNAVEAAGLNFLQHFYWRKTNPPPQPRKNFCSAIETAIFARKPGKVLCWNGGGTTHNVFEYPIVTGPERTKHPTQKPVPLMLKLCRLVVPKDGVVLDPFLGSGTTAEAAWLHGANCIGIELNKSYYEIAKHRIDKLQPQSRFLEMVG